MLSMLFRGLISGLPKPCRLGFRASSTGDGIGGDCGRDLVDVVMASTRGTTSRGRDRDRERDLRYGRTLGTSRKRELVLAMAQDARGWVARREEERRRGESMVWLRINGIIMLSAERPV